MDNDDVVSTLNDLIETCRDGEEGFKTCAEDLSDAQAKSTFTKRAQECAQAAAELQQEVRSLGGNPETHGSMSGTMHRRWVDIKAAITGNDDEAILNECERGEDVAVKEYKDALAKDLPVAVRLIVERQYQGVLRNHAQVKVLRDEARAHG
ncbi:MAG: PA2169 family four-helix-bundle protein [Herminiimonas sp.]|nr:PA2169 family four-helix-bundle protein [Herminiimonas sp.]